MKKRVFLSIFSLFTLISSIYAQSSNTAARDAERRLEEALSGSAANSVQSTRGGSEPRWVNDPYTVYSRSRYLAAVGFAPNRTEAEKRAFAALVAIFGQSLQSDFSTTTIYSEAVSNGVISVSENINIRDMIVTASSMDTLIGSKAGTYIFEGNKWSYYP